MLSSQSCSLFNHTWFKHGNVPCFLHEILILALRTWEFSWYLKYNILVITSTSREPGGTKFEVVIGVKGTVSLIFYRRLQKAVNLACLRRDVWLTNYSLFKEVWDLLAVWAEIQNNFSIFPNSSPLPNYSSQMNVLLPSEIRQSRKEIIMHFHLEHRILIPFFLLLTDLSIFLLTCFKYDKFYLSQYHSSSIKLHPKNCHKQAGWKGTSIYF